MRQKVLSIITAAIICLSGFALINPEAAFASSDDQGFVITNYRMEAQVHENNSMDIRETIVVNFSQRKHGIYRTIPTWLRINMAMPGKRSHSYEYSCEVSNADVKGWKWEYGDSDEYSTQLVIGDANKKVSGKQTYEISYNYAYPDDRIDGYDFIYHNVLGDQWSVPIEHFEFEMKFDKPLPKSALEDLRVYSGIRGTTDNSLNVDLEASKTRLAGTAENIAPGEAVTIRAELPEGYFKGERHTSPVPSIIGLVIAFVGAVLILFNVIRTRRKKPVRTVEFHAPDDISPAEVGTIIDETADDKDLLSLIPWFADRGHLTVKIVEKERKIRKDQQIVELTKVKDLPEDAPEYQKMFFNLLFKEGDVRLMDKLGEDFGKDFLEAKKELTNEFEGERKLSTGTLKACILAGIVTVGAALFYGFSSCVATFENFVPGVMAVAFFAVAIIACGFVKSRKHKILTIIMIIVALLIELGNVALFCDEYSCMFAPGFCLLVFAICGAVSILSAGIIAPTDYKIKTIGKLLGLRDFIKVAELDKLNALVEENPNYYFDILPYAMAFGLEEKWSKHFENIKIKAPGWYDMSDGYGAFNTIAFTNMVTRNMSSSVGSAVSACSSGGGGGFSGGGGGGGGGGSW